MPTRIDLLYESLLTPGQIQVLFDRAEDSDIECKQWRGDEGSKRTMLAKAVTGFANGDGGVLILGLRADARGKEEPDVIKEPAYVGNLEATKAKVLSFIQNDVEPLVQSLRVDTVDMTGAGEGVILVFVPSADGLPHRSKQDWKFYLRSGSSTQNMPLTVLADRFGRRPHAALTASVASIRYGVMPGFISNGTWRGFDLCVENRGRGVARFPSLMRSTVGSVPLRSGFPEQPLWFEHVDPIWTSNRGNANDVLYPGENRKIVTLYQSAREVEGGVATFAECRLRVKTVCLNAPEVEQTLTIPHADTTQL